MNMSLSSTGREGAQRDTGWWGGGYWIPILSVRVHCYTIAFAFSVAGIGLRVNVTS